MKKKTVKQTDNVEKTTVEEMADFFRKDGIDFVDVYSEAEGFLNLRDVPLGARPFVYATITKMAPLAKTNETPDEKNANVFCRISVTNIL